MVTSEKAVFLFHCSGQETRPNSQYLKNFLQPFDIQLGNLNTFGLIKAVSDPIFDEIPLVMTQMGNINTFSLINTVSVTTFDMIVTNHYENHHGS